LVPASDEIKHFLKELVLRELVDHIVELEIISRVADQVLFLDHHLLPGQDSLHPGHRLRTDIPGSQFGGHTFQRGAHRVDFQGGRGGNFGREDATVRDAEKKTL
jgi:hypothetical protein